MDTAHRIDTHHHVVPPVYAEWLAKHDVLAGGLPIPHWSEQLALGAMDALGVHTAVLSVSTPSVHLGDGRYDRAEASDMARAVNEFSASVVRAHPDRFGFFATVPLPHVDDAIAEIDHAYDQLGADGVVLLANTAGVYLGDPSTHGVFDALERRRAVVFVHPSSLPGPAVDGLPAFLADFLLDTTRAALLLATSGTMDRCPNLKVVLSHAGGFPPYAAYRVAPFCTPGFAHEEGITKLRRFWFDTALSASASALPSLLAFADPTHVVFGSDWPYAPERIGRYFVDELERNVTDAATRHAIDRGNAEALFPRFGGR